MSSMAYDRNKPSKSRGNDYRNRLIGDPDAAEKEPGPSVQQVCLLQMENCPREVGSMGRIRMKVKYPV